MIVLLAEWAIHFPVVLDSLKPLPICATEVAEHTPCFGIRVGKKEQGYETIWQRALHDETLC
ncbi:hypothetical protein BZM27_06830 [Paraburkholderia steynii]|uniref:Uncharacterized protein n=1 Tax=Paraburkholderia steynii TaxID=1245441 RepID=A0A4R0XFZ7_9BURK|nr:hypothetical protein BZM27_06830 [Paraburkholderia steynii]